MSKHGKAIQRASAALSFTEIIKSKREWNYRLTSTKQNLGREEMLFSSKGKQKNKNHKTKYTTRPSSFYIPHLYGSGYIEVNQE